MRPLELEQKRNLYRFTKTVFAVAGGFLIILGGWYFIDGVLISHSPLFWFGLLPAYVGAMLILVSFAMRIEWFTDTRRFW